MVPSEVCLEWPRRQDAPGPPEDWLPAAPGDGGDMGDPKGFSLSNTGEPRGCSSGVLAADEPGEAGRSSSG